MNESREEAEETVPVQMCKPRKERDNQRQERGQNEVAQENEALKEDDNDEEGPRTLMDWMADK